MAKRHKNESYPDYIDRTFPHLSYEDRNTMKEIAKEAWFDGLKFEREHNMNEV